MTHNKIYVVFKNDPTFEPVVCTTERCADAIINWESQFDDKQCYSISYVREVLQGNDDETIYVVSCSDVEPCVCKSLEEAQQTAIVDEACGFQDVTIKAYRGGKEVK